MRALGSKWKLLLTVTLDVSREGCCTASEFLSRFAEAVRGFRSLVLIRVATACMNTHWSPAMTRVPAADPSLDRDDGD